MFLENNEENYNVINVYKNYENEHVNNNKNINKEQNIKNYYKSVCRISIKKYSL